MESAAGLASVDMSRCQRLTVVYTLIYTHTRNTGPIEPVCQSRYQLISVSSNGKADLQSVDTAKVLIC